MPTLEISEVGRHRFPHYPDAQPGETLAVKIPPLPPLELSTRTPSGWGILDPLSFAPTIDPRLKIKKPFTVRFHRFESGVAAHAEEIEEFGQGANGSEALIDLGKTIAELYFSLEAEADRLAPDLQSLRAKLTEHIVQIRTPK